MFKDFFKILRRFVPPYKKYLNWALVLNVLSAILNIFSFSLIIPILQILFKMDQKIYQFIPWDTADTLKDKVVNNFYYYINHMISIYGESTTLLIIGVFLAVTTLLKTASIYGSIAVMIPLSNGVVRDIQRKIYSKLLSLPIGFYSEERKGDIMARMSGDVNEVERSITGSLNMLIKNPILITAYFITLIVISWQLTIFTIVVLPIMGFIIGRVGRSLKRKSTKAQQALSDTLTHLEETLGGLRIIKAFLAEKKMNEKYSELTDNFRNTVTRVNMRQQMSGPMGEFLGTCLIVSVLWFGGTLILQNNSPIEAPSFIYYLVILFSILQPFKDLTKATYSIPRGMASMERIDKILGAENPITEIKDPENMDPFNKEIEFKHVDFSYGDKQVLKDINLKVPFGKTIALVGQSGSGKSTLVDLIPRFYDVDKGEIIIDGHNIKSLRISDLRLQMGNVNQEAILFNDSFFNNIAFGVENATLDKVMEAAKIANAHDFIMENTEGYDALVGDRGGKLSGGQRQRISIARAILKNPPILILDEATSALDTESEKLVQEALDHLMKNRTTIAIAHRLSTIKNADEICVMNEGAIVERGTHQELIELGGYYKRLNDMQL
ncbi:MAG: ABC transporter ATP-binding protein [Bacteroidaceae bacterium]